MTHATGETGYDDIVYWLDAKDKICFVNEAYDRFAAANGGPAVASPAVLHQSIWNYITDSTTRQIYRNMLARVRAGRPIEFRIRCDSPAHRRLLQINVSLNDKDLVVFRIGTIAEVTRPRVALLDAKRARSGELLRMCSWCNKVQLGGDWVEVGDAVVRLHLFEKGMLPGLTHGICEQCSASMMAALAVE